MGRDYGDRSATEQIRQAQDWAGGTGHLLTLWTAAIRQILYPGIDQQITVRLTEPEARRYQREPSRPALHQQLRTAQLAGHDISGLIDQITAAPMDGAQSIASVLHGRLQRLTLPGLRHDATWARRTPATVPAVAHELAAALDDRTRALGDQMAGSPEPWLARHLGVLAPDASPALRAEYTRRAGIAAAYREAAGITNPDQAVSPMPHRGNPELDAMRKTVLAALEIRDETDILRHLDRGELEARAFHGQRARAAAPPDVSSQLRLTAQAEADAHRHAADAQTCHDRAGAASATALAARLAGERQRLEAASARYEQWSAGTRATRDAAGKATAELQRRGHAQRESQPRQRPDNEAQQMAGWWYQLDADAGAVNCVDVSEYQAARLRELLTRADQAAQRIAAQQAERQASSEYAVRMELEAQTQAEAGRSAQARDDVELEPLRRSLSALPDEPVDQVVHQGYRLCLTGREVNSSARGGVP
jgi:hypothetical protein